MSKPAALPYLATLDNESRRQRSHLTFKGNVRQGRHGWLRLTPAYSLHVVNEVLDGVGATDLVHDPFSGTATTTLASVARGVRCHSVDVNPFLVWFGNLKLTKFQSADGAALVEASRCVEQSMRSDAGSARLWRPDLHQIEKWWPADVLAPLTQLFQAICDTRADGRITDLMKVAFCKAAISTANVSFGHQSMSFRKEKSEKRGTRRLFELNDERSPRNEVLRQFQTAIEEIHEGIGADAPQAPGEVFLGDSRNLPAVLPSRQYTTVITSPPYPNRMSYIRELRPYMYWLGFLRSGREAGELDWKAIGGTWGCATSNLGAWTPENGEIAYSSFNEIVARIRRRHPLLANYVHKYFDDAKQHIGSLRHVMSKGGKCYYIVGNSKFYDTLLPVEEIYAALFENAGFHRVSWRAIRKRNSKKELYEFIVSAEQP
jgi:hypothetical protein